MKKERGLKIILICSIIAIITSAYLLYSHYATTDSFCDINPSISCDIVNRSLYSEIFGIPISLMSLLAFIFILIITILASKDKINSEKVINIIYWLMILSVIFALYLIYIEAFVLYSVCPLCIVLDILILIILIFIVLSQ